MTRGVLSLFALCVMVAVWLGYLLQLQKLNTMTQKEQIEKLSADNSELESKNKSYLEAIDVKNNRITQLEKELANQKSLQSIFNDKITAHDAKTKKMNEITVQALKEIRSRIDSLMLYNLEERFNDEQSGKPKIPQHGQDGTKSSGD